MTDHNVFIEKLTREAGPVSRPLTGGKRVLVWLLMALPCGWASSLLVYRLSTDWSHSGSWLAAMQLSLTFIMGVLAIRNAFSFSIAGRKPLSGWWFLPLFLLWLAGVILSMGQTHVRSAHPEEVNCYAFMMTVSLPMMLLVVGYLRRTRAINPLRALASAGAGVACMALTLLAFCHPVETHYLDFLLHFAAFISIVSLTVLLGWRWVVIR